jgi:hypothetical protein
MDVVPSASLSDGLVAPDRRQRDLELLFLTPASSFVFAQTTSPFGKKTALIPCPNIVVNYKDPTRITSRMGENRL